MKILIVDDSLVFRKILSEVMANFADSKEIIIAQNGKIALEKAKIYRPDVITLDVEMPDMNGLEVLRQMRADGVTSEVIIVSSHTESGVDIAIESLQKGALDIIAKPQSGDLASNIKALERTFRPLFAGINIRRKILGVSKPDTIIKKKPPVSSQEITKRMRKLSTTPVKPEIIAIGASTGGPNALKEVLSGLPGNLKVPIVITLHMPKDFTGRMAETLNNKSQLNVMEAKNGQLLEAGKAYLAPGGTQMKVVAGKTGGLKEIKVTDDPPENNCKPAVDYLFRSVAKEYGGKSMGIILTGMGSDGVEGLKLMKQNNSFTVAQDEESCTVFGMPMMAIKAGVIDVVVSLDKVKDEITKCVR